MRWQKNSSNQVNILNLIWKQQQKNIFLVLLPVDITRQMFYPQGFNKDREKYFYLSDTYINCLVWSDIF